MRWNALVRHGLISTSLVGAAAVPAIAAPCDEIAPGTVGFVIGFNLGDTIKPMGGLEGRVCVDRRTEAMVRLEAGGGGPVRVIGGLRVRPFERQDFDDGWGDDQRDREDLGVEAGLVIDGRDARLGAHVAATFGTHSAYAALQGHLPTRGSPRVALAFGFAPWTAFDRDDEELVPGRPLVRDGLTVRPGFAAPLAAIASAEARAVRDHFAGSAQIEYSSVWTFLRLAAELSAAGAPAELIAAALDAADDEVRHAELCARAAGGIALVPLPPAMAQARFTRRSPRALALLAAEAWREGCLDETAAAEEARLAAGDAEGPARAMLAGIAVDETRHAELSWSVLAWIFSIAPEVAAQAVAAVPPFAAGRAARAADRALARHGVASPAVIAAARAHAARLAAARLTALS